jgi:hypothetical protein
MDQEPPIWTFIKTAGAWGWGSMLGALGFLVLSAVEHTKAHDVSGYIYLLVAVVLFCIGAYLAWKNDYDRLLKELVKNSHPEFQLEVSRLFHDVTPKQGTPWLDRGNIYVAKMSVVNVKDSPSSLRDIYVCLGDESSKFSAQSFGTAQLSWSREGPTRKFSSGETYAEEIFEREIITDLLPSICEPMPRGAHKEGWVYISDLPCLDDSDTFGFYVTDAYGTSHGPFQSKVEMDVGNVRK